MAEVALGANEFRALSSETRVQIIKLLGSRRHNLTEIANRLGMRLPTIKQHLGVLERAGLIEQLESARKWKYYSLTAKGNALAGKAEASILIVLALASIAIIGLLYEFSGKLAIFFSQGVMQPIAGILPQEAPKMMSAGITGATGAAKDEAAEIAAGAVAEQAAQAVASVSTADVVLYIAVIIAIALIIAFCILKMRKKPKLSYFVDKRNK